MMKAIVLSRFGGPDQLTFREVPKPVPGRTEVLIRVGAAGVNFAETLMREDRYVASYSLPAIPGSEVAGTVVEVGPDVVDIEPGQRVGAVLAVSRMLTGGYAEFAVADASVTAVLPDGLAFTTATGLLVQGLTALHLVREVTPAGRNVLVTAAAGGVGSQLVQLVRRGGAASVTAVASSAEKRASCLALGVDNAIGYEEIAGQAPDLIYDSAGGEAFLACLRALAPRGTLVAYGALNLEGSELGAADLKAMVLGNQSLRGFALGALIDRTMVKYDLATLFDYALNGGINIRVETFPLREAGSAHRAIAGRRTKGKVALVV